jgi:uncharacterized protein YlxW (UPF0749 family)
MFRSFCVDCLFQRLVVRQIARLALAIAKVATKKKDSTLMWFHKLQTLLKDDCDELSCELQESSSELECVIEEACEEICKLRHEVTSCQATIQALECEIKHLKDECASQAHSSSCNEKVIQRLTETLHKLRASKSKLEQCLTAKN